MQLERMYISAVLLNRRLPKNSYLKKIPSIIKLEQQPLVFDTPVTILVGENGSGKSTLLEAIALQCGFNPEGGSVNALFSTRDTHSNLHEYLTIQKRNYYHPGRSFFLRAESYYNVLSNYGDIDDLPQEYSHHNCSHGESFIEMAQNRMIGKGLYLLDEPEAALSPGKMMNLMYIMHEAEKNESQFIIATHSPILMSYPGATVYLFDEDGFEKADYHNTDHYCITRSFLENPQRMFDELFRE